MRILIVDDEPPARLRLRGLLQQFDDVEVVGEAGDGNAALKQVEALNPDCVLLDIRMPGMDGLECARRLAALSTPPAVVFVTAYDRFAIEAFEAQAMDYLVKPVRRERLEAAINRAQRPNAAQRAALEAAATRNALGRRRQICVRVRDSLRLVDVESIYYFRADQKYVTVRHNGGEVLIEDSLKSLEEEFPEDFVRIHRNALVAVRAIDALEKDDHGHFHVRLRGLNEKLEVSRRLVPEVRQLIRTP
ncbi:MAG: LytTR family DNA-binding domain-containing protein [Proteobacteria bacterium]|nr:LytTR family DNA-binding domain-containing protein [Pseudomonadota bacterium]